MPRSTQIGLVCLTFLAYVLRVPGLFANHFHADEALFASWARLIAVWRDPLLQTQLVDKPPLLFYLQALFYPMQGPVEWAARLPNFIASILLVPLVAVLVWRLYGQATTAVWAAVIITLSPLCVQFSATGFTDPLLTVWLVLALVCVAGVVSRGAVVAAGVCFALAVLSKHQAWLFGPLLVGVVVWRGWRWREGGWWLVGFGPVAALLWLWEMGRTGAFALWSQQMSNFGGLRLIWSWEIWPRWWAWLDLGQQALGSWLLVGGLVLSGFVLLGRLYRFEKGEALIDGWLVVYGGGYFLFHWLVAVPVWDRYLLPLMPLLAIVLARGGWCFYGGCMAIWGRADYGVVGSDGRRGPMFAWVSTRFYYGVGGLLLVMWLLPAAWQARHGGFLLGGYSQADEGAAMVAAFLAEEPYGTVLYDHWYSWHWRYHLFDKRVFVHWFPHPAALAEDLMVFGGDEQTRYVALPNTAVSLPVKRAIYEADFQLQAVVSSTHQTLYQIVP